MITQILTIEVLGMFGLSVAVLVGLMVADYIGVQRRFKADVSRVSAQQADAHEPVTVF